MHAQSGRERTGCIAQNGTDYFTWKGSTAIIQPNQLSTSGMTRSLIMVLMALSKCPLNTDRLRALITISRYPIPVFDHSPRIKKFLLVSNLNLPRCSFQPFLHVLSLPPRERRWASHCQFPMLRNLQRAIMSHLSPLFSKLEKPKDLSGSSQDMSSSTLTNLVVLFWMHSNSPTSFLNS